MTKKDIVMQIAEKPALKQMTQAQIKEVVQATFDNMIENLAAGRTIELRNFGVFKVKMRKGRMARNPKTAEKVPVPDRRVVTFKPGLVMKQKVGGKK
ncbi:MAG: HU family DNA-binding protein [Candidatus Omnitrophota bacterium]